MSEPQIETTAVVDNPFAFMLDPDAVWRALERSERLARLQRRICRPLDKPLAAPGAADAPTEGGPVADEADGG